MNIHFVLVADLRTLHSVLLDSDAIQHFYIVPVKVVDSFGFAVFREDIIGTLDTQILILFFRFLLVDKKKIHSSADISDSSIISLL